MTACIVGWAHTPFGKLANESDPDVEEIVLGHFNSGFSPQDFTTSLATRVCARGSAAVHQGRAFAIKLGHSG